MKSLQICNWVPHDFDMTSQNLLVSSQWLDLTFIFTDHHTSDMPMNTWASEHHMSHITPHEHLVKMIQYWKTIKNDHVAKPEIWRFITNLFWLVFLVDTFWPHFCYAVNWETWHQMKCDFAKQSLQWGVHRVRSNWTIWNYTFFGKRDMLDDSIHILLFEKFNSHMITTHKERHGYCQPHFQMLL